MVRLGRGLAFLAAIGATAARAEDRPLAAFRQCLENPDAVATQGTVSIPPGLTRRSQVIVEQIRAGRGAIYAYRGTASYEIACGVALYGPVDPSLARRLRRLVKSLRPNLPLSEHQVHDANGQLVENVAGVVVETREPSARAPTLEADYHSILIR